MQEYMTAALVGICVILMIFSFITNSLSEKRKVILFLMLFSSVILLLTTELSKIYDGDISTFGIVVARGSKFLTYETSLVIIYFFSRYVKDMLGIEATKLLKFSDLSLAIGGILVVVSQFTGLYYSYDADNFYRRSAYYGISYAFSSIALGVIVVCIIKHRETFSRKLFLTFLMFTIAPLVTSIAHMIFKGASLISATVVAMTVLLYCFSILDSNEVTEKARKKEIENAKLMLSQTAAALAEAIDAKDAYTSGHSRRVAEYSAKIAERFGKDADYCQEIYLVGLLHDVGKIGIPGSIINKESSLSDEEYALIKTHPQKGKEILSKISISPNLVIGANYHHERWDGRGYPEGLEGEEIPEMARIIAVADAYDAMASKRSYRDGLPKEKIRQELVRGIRTQFDPVFAATMIFLLDEGLV